MPAAMFFEEVKWTEGSHDEKKHRRRHAHFRTKAKKSPA
jgi:hypothetical protein